MSFASYNETKGMPSASSCNKCATVRHPTERTHRTERSETAEPDPGQELLRLLLRRDVVADGLWATTTTRISLLPLAKSFGRKRHERREYCPPWS